MLLDINMPGMDGLQTAAAIRRLEGELRNVPIMAITAHSVEATLRAAQAAGMAKFITKPIEPAVLYRTLATLIAGTSAAQEPLRTTPGSRATMAGNALLDPARLESYSRIGMLEELLGDYVPEIAALVGKLQQHAAQNDLEACIDVLHSLLGMSGEAGAQALYQAARRAYVPMVETRSWPSQPDWAGHIAALAAETEQALKAYDPAQVGANP